MMAVATASPQIAITNIRDVDHDPNITHTVDVTDTTATEPPIVISGASVIPPPPPPPTPAGGTASTTTTTTIATRSTTPSATTTLTDTTTSSTTEIPSSSPANKTTPQKDSSPKQCPDLFLVSNKDFEENDGKIKNDHHHTIIINNKNKAAVVFDHKTMKDKKRGDDDGSADSPPAENHSNNVVSSANRNTGERTPGSIVTAICSHGTVPLAVTFLECQSNGKWNGTLPHCHGPMDVSSNTLYFSVIGGVCGLTILILVFIYLVMMKSKRRDKGPASPPLDPDKAIYVDPYAVGERLYSIPAPVQYTRGDITYAKPQIYSTYLNPSFYEDAYQRWRRQEQHVSEKLYDSPFINTRSSHQWGDNQDPSWTLNRPDKQVDKLHIPRAKISAMDQGSVRSHDSVSTMTFTGPRQQRVLYGRSASVVSTNSTMPRYSNGQFPRRPSNLLEQPPPGLHLVKAFEDVPPPTLHEYDMEHMPDGRTPF